MTKLVYLLCRKKNNVIKEIKMKNSITTGLKKHLQKYRKKTFENLFESKIINDKFILPDKQKTIDVFLNVSIEIKFYKLYRIINLCYFTSKCVDLPYLPCIYFIFCFKLNRLIL